MLESLKEFSVYMTRDEKITLDIKIFPWFFIVFGGFFTSFTEGNKLISTPYNNILKFSYQVHK